MTRVPAVMLALLWLHPEAFAQARRAAPPALPEAPAETSPPYEPRLLRLAEILGALAHLTAICATKDAGQWRGKMQALIDAEARNPGEKGRLAGAYNRGFRGYALSYRSCTPNAEAIISRFLAEGGQIADEIVNRFGAS